MKDRTPTEVLANGAIRYGVYNADGTLNRYEYIKPEDAPTQEGTPLNKASLLSDTTAALYGLGAGAVPDTALQAIDRLFGGYRLFEGFALTSGGRTIKNNRAQYGAVKAGTFVVMDGGVSTTSPLYVFNLQSKENFMVGNKTSTSFNRKLACSGDKIYSFCHGSGSSMLLYEVDLLKRTFTVLRTGGIANGNAHFIATNGKFILMGGKTVAAWDIQNKTFRDGFGSIADAPNLEASFMQGDYLYVITASGTIHRYEYTGVGSLTDYASTGIGGKVVQSVSTIEDEAFYVLSNSILYGFFAPKMEMVKLHDFSDTLLPTVSRAVVQTVSMSDALFYIKTSSMTYAFDRTTFRLLSASSSDADIEYPASCSDGCEVSARTGNEIRKVPRVMIEKRVLP